MNVIVYAIPVFVALMAAEFGISLALGRNVYRLNDAIGSLAAGILSQISGVFMLVLSVGIYILVYNHFSLLSLQARRLASVGRGADRLRFLLLLEPPHRP